MNAAETVAFLRCETTLSHGLRAAGQPTTLGSMRVLCAPGQYERATQAGRTVATSGYDLYLRGAPAFAVRIGDKAVIRDETLTVTHTPEEWRRGGRCVGVQYHVEREEDL
ncbi:hypothetical protein [Bifidobacterium samirii]|uniref:Phage protein n=1 Tax=Bifidobacterium samirii TaxID=2306974 RepID=A0A430FJG2_9BIFI|nr:hypothetical protein [Bifidobacterium samirii]RSX53024.1 hypothetical protein D2E24_1695 [Bifidobacterium samirii]